MLMQQPPETSTTSARAQLPSISSPAVIVGVVISLGIALIVSQEFFVQFNTLVSVGLAFAITGFCVMVHPLSKWSTLDILGAGALSGGISLMASVFILSNPSASPVEANELLSELWLLLIFIEAFSLYTSTYFLGRRIVKPLVVWLVTMIVALSVLMALFGNVSWMRLYHNGSYSPLGFTLLFATFALLISAGALGIRKIAMDAKLKQWSIGVVTTSTLLTMTSMTLLPNLIANSTATAIGHITHLLAYTTIFMMILTTVVLNPMSSIFKKLYDERELFAEWDRLSVHLLNFTDQVAQATSYQDLVDATQSALAESFNAKGVAIFLLDSVQATPAELALSYKFSEDPDAFAQARDYAMRQLRQRSEDNEELIRFSQEIFGRTHRFVVRKLKRHNRTFGFVLAARDDSEVYASNELLTRYFDKFAATLQLALNRLQIEASHEQLMIKERYIADTLQRAMRPVISDLPNVAHASRLIPASGLTKIGGDFLDAFAGVDPSIVYFMIGDISGHGVEATSRNSFVRAAMKATALTGLAPSDIMEKINNLICSDLPEDTYVTAVCGTLDTKSGLCEVCIAGHPEPLFMHAQAITQVALVRNPLLGFQPDVCYQSYLTTLKPDDSIVLYTDGITDARSKSNELYGLNRLIEMITSHRGATPETTLDRLYAAISRFEEGIAPHDDQAVLVLRWSPTIASDT